MNIKNLEISDVLKLHLKQLREALAGISIGDYEISDPQGCDPNCGAVCRNTCSYYCRDSCEASCRGNCDDFFSIGCTLKVIF